MTASSPAPRPSSPQRREKTLGDMLRSMGLLVALVLAVVLGGRALVSSDPEPVESVDLRSTVHRVREVAPFPIAAPRSLPEGWRATSTKYERGSEGRWHLGVLTADEDYVGLEQTPVSVSSTVDRFAPKTHRVGRTTIDGDSWQVRRSGDGETSLVRRKKGLTTLVTGTASRGQLEAYAASLVTGRQRGPTAGSGSRGGR